MNFFVIAFFCLTFKHEFWNDAINVRAIVDTIIYLKHRLTFVLKENLNVELLKGQNLRDSVLQSPKLLIKSPFERLQWLHIEKCIHKL